jgi:hypothetical protein
MSVGAQIFNGVLGAVEHQFQLKCEYVCFNVVHIVEIAILRGMCCISTIYARHTGAHIDYNRTSTSRSIRLTRLTITRNVMLKLLAAILTYCLMLACCINSESGRCGGKLSTTECCFDLPW